MAYLALEFPRRIALNAQRSPGWSTTLVETFGGDAFVNQEWARARHEFDVALAIRTATDYMLVATHFYETRGRANWFRFRDPLDNACTVLNGIATLISGSVYQLGKRYGAANPYDRRITRPVFGAATFYRTRASVSSVIAPTVDYETGRMTVSDHEDGDTYQWAGLFDVPTEYASDELPAVVPDRNPDGGELLVRCDSVTLIEHRE